MSTPPKTTVLSSNDIRRLFLDYFSHHEHTQVDSSSLIPGNDPTLLFTNAGMVQFKDVFLGSEVRPYQRAASSQRCLRAGGKHNDLERVGYTARHHTFFEMLGNFSFGDYFKQDAIRFAWDFLTNHLHLPKEKLWVTVYQNDPEAEAIWLNDIKIDPKRFSRCGDEDNFWSMGPTGPCGPCTEIFFDHGEDIPGGPPGSPDADGDRYVEIWNLVFMQYDRAADGTLTPLPKPSVDTGMGLERITAVVQGVHNNYDTDSFQPLIKAAAALAGIKQDHTESDALFSLRVIADHIRSSCFLINDGVTPSNEGRGYVLRRIIRRALRHGHKLGLTQAFFYKLVNPLIANIGKACPDLAASQTRIEKTLEQEEAQFSQTLSQGLKLFEQVILNQQSKLISGETIFKLYDTYGFPADLTADMARERGLSLDLNGFEAAMQQQRERSRDASQFTGDYRVATEDQPPTEFTGHQKRMETSTDAAKILAIYREGKFADTLKAGEKGSIVLDRTPFYAESGGQVGDQGMLHIPPATALFNVFDTIKQGHTHLHLGKLEKGELHIGDEVHTEVDAKRRAAIVLNHTATHLLHLILKQILGEHAIQKGSLVEPERLRFDFVHAAPLTQAELQTIEHRVNEEIRANYKAKVAITTPEEALAGGAVGLFGEKYGRKVRVVHFGPSVELCGGTHAEHTGDIGFFKITSETGVAAGIRRIEAVTGDNALRYLEKREADTQHTFSQMETRSAQLEKEIEQLKSQLAQNMSHALITKARSIGQINVLATVVEGLDGKALRSAVDHLKQALKSGVIILATVKDNKIGIVGGVTADLTDTLNAKDIVNHIAQQVGGKGGGRAELAEAGGNRPEHLDKALQDIYTWIQTKVTH